MKEFVSFSVRTVISLNNIILDLIFTGCFVDKLIYDLKKRNVELCLRERCTGCCGLGINRSYLK